MSSYGTLCLMLSTAVVHIMDIPTTLYSCLVYFMCLGDTDVHTYIHTELSLLAVWLVSWHDRNSCSIFWQRRTCCMFGEIKSTTKRLLHLSLWLPFRKKGLNSFSVLCSCLVLCHSSLSETCVWDKSFYWESFWSTCSTPPPSPPPDISYSSPTYR